jgi:hypothetical protein
MFIPPKGLFSGAEKNYPFCILERLVNSGDWNGIFGKVMRFYVK